MKKILLFLSFLLINFMHVNGTILFHETFGNNSSSARVWNDSYKVQSGIVDVYCNATTYTITNAKQSKNNMGYGTTKSTSNTDGSAIVCNQGSQGVIIIGPLNVSIYTSLTLTHWFGKSSGASDTWNESRASHPDIMKVSYSPDNETWFTMVRSGNNPTGAVSQTSTNHNYVQATYSLPEISQISTLYLKFEFYCYQLDKNSKEIGQIYIDDIELSGIELGISHNVTYINKNDGSSIVINYNEGQHTLLDTLDNYMHWDFCGWSPDTTNCIPLTSMNINSDKTLYAVFRYGTEQYQLVENDLDDWRGEYLVAHSSSIFADGRVGGTTGLGAQYASVDPDTHLSGKIIDADWGNLYNITLDTVTGGYVMITKDGKYNYQTSNTNGLPSTDNKSTARTYPLSVTFNSSSDIDIANSAGAVFHYNTDGYFRFYKNGGQSNIYLYKKINGYTYCINPSNIQLVEWMQDSIKLSINNYDSINVGNGWELLSLQQDGTYRIYINDLSGKSCSDLFLKTRKTNRVDCIGIFKVPIFITENNENNSTINNSDSASCDLVILKDGKLTLTDNLENRDITIYPNGTLNIPTGKTYTVNSLTLRRDNDSVPYLSYNGMLNIKNGMFFEMRTDGSDWRWLTLPDTFRIKDIDGNNWGENGGPLIKYYNGAYRAEHGTGGWQWPFNNTIDYNAKFAPGAGVNFGEYNPYSNTQKRIYKLQLDTNILSKEKQDKSIQVYAYPGTSTTPPNDKGWNVIGNPFMDIYKSDLTEPIQIGKLKKDSVNGQWTGKWIIDPDSETKELRYIVVKNHDEKFADANYYETVLLTDNYELKPFTSFFIQVSDTALLTFNKSSKVSRVKSSNHTNKNNEIFLRVCIGNKKTGCFISNKFNDTYEIGDDIESNESIYQLINGYKLLYSAINDSIIEHGIKIYTPAGNLHLDDKTNVEDFEEIYAFYNDEWIDLLHGQTQDVSGEFILFAKRKKQETIPTDIDIIKDNNEIIKFMHNNNLYIKKNNHIFNILGGVIK